MELVKDQIAKQSVELAELLTGSDSLTIDEIAEVDLNLYRDWFQRLVSHSITVQEHLEQDFITEL
jgi:hypothetical protein